MRRCRIKQRWRVDEGQMKGGGGIAKLLVTMHIETLPSDKLCYVRKGSFRVFSQVGELAHVRTDEAKQTKMSLSLKCERSTR